MYKSHVKATVYERKEAGEWDKWADRRTKFIIPYMHSHSDYTSHNISFTTLPLYIRDDRVFILARP
jgi:hypothetical protein